MNLFQELKAMRDWHARERDDYSGHAEVGMGFHIWMMAGAAAMQSSEVNK